MTARVPKCSSQKEADVQRRTCTFSNCILKTNIRNQTTRNGTYDKITTEVTCYFSLSLACLQGMHENRSNENRYAYHSQIPRTKYIFVHEFKNVRQISISGTKQYSRQCTNHDLEKRNIERFEWKYLKMCICICNQFHVCDQIKHMRGFACIPAHWLWSPGNPLSMQLHTWTS